MKVFAPCRQRRLRGLACFLAALVVMPAQAQLQQIGRNADIPRKILEIRAEQARLAAEAGIVVTVKDEGGRSASRIADGVPIELADEIIATEHDLIGLLESIHRYYGFSGTETLEYQRKYQIFEDMTYFFVQYIDGIETANLFDVQVNRQTGRISRFRGWLDLDRDLPRVPAMSEEDAIAIALCVAQHSDWYDPRSVDPDGLHEAQVSYQPFGPDMALTPFWRVHLTPPADRSGIQTSILVGPDGMVKSERRRSHGPGFEMPAECTGRN